MKSIAWFDPCTSGFTLRGGQSDPTFVDDSELPFENTISTYNLESPQIYPWAPTSSLRRILPWVILSGVLLAVSGSPSCGFAQGKQPRKAETPKKQEEPSRNEYVGSAACARCHQSIYQSYTRTDMGRSMARVTPELIRTLSLPGSIYNAKFDRHYDVFSRDGKLYQSEWQSGADGHDVFRSTHEIGWIIGAGHLGFGGLLQRGNYLFEAPLSFYTKTQQWGLSPGYEHTDVAFNRPVMAECAFCHSGRATPLDQTTGKFAAKPFSQLAIGCENCHGPGALHTQAMSAHPNGLDNLRIVNPSLLSANLENELCMSCHEGGDSRVPKSGKSYLDFRPGNSLDDTLSILMMPMNPASPEDRDHLHYFFQMSMSKCYQATVGQLRCTTCHNPHVEPSPKDSPAYFNQKCMSCHAEPSHACTGSADARQRTTPANNCIGCHMPRKDVAEIDHASLTNHRILARPDESWPVSAFQLTTPSLPDLVHLNPVPGRPEDLPPLILLAAYKDLAIEDPRYFSLYLDTLGGTEQTDPNNAKAQMELGAQDLRENHPDEAAEHLRHSIKLAPQVAATYEYLSIALQRKNLNDEAIVAIERAVSLEPYNPLYQRVRLQCLMNGKRYSQAQAALNHYLEVFPEDPVARNLQAQLTSLENTDGK